MTRTAKTVTILTIMILCLCGIPLRQAQDKAFAGTLPDTGQTKCYNNTSEIACPASGEDFYGQDAQYSTNPRSYTKLQGGIVVQDNVTGLIWEVKTDDGSVHDKDNTYNWDDAQSVFIAALNSEKFGGYSDWRLPTIKELGSIVNLERYNPTIDTNYFPHTISSPDPNTLTSAQYWSSTDRLGTSDSAWSITFIDGSRGNVGSKKYKENYVRAVRGTNNSSFNFVDNGDGTVTDIGTGLMWQQEASGLVVSWKDALAYCENLSYAGYNDWRLPNRGELLSIMNYGKYDLAIDDNYFPNMIAHWYCSSTSNVSQTEDYWNVHSSNGGDSCYYPKAGIGCVPIAVRGGVTPQTHTLTTNIAPAVGGNTISRSSDKSAYDHNESVTLTATPDDCYNFTNWSGDCSGTSPTCTLTMDSDKSATANFAIKTYSLTVTASNGSVTKSPSASTYDCGTTVSLTANPNTGYHFVRWEGDVSGTSTSASLTMTANRSVTAIFEENIPDTYTLTKTVSPASGGSVSASPDKSAYTSGESVTLTATPEACYDFTGWSGACSGTSSACTLTMDSDKSVTANFAIKTCSLSITAENGTVSKSPDQVSYDCGTTVLLTASPNSGYNFDHWEGDATGTQTTASLTMTEDMSITAVFVSGSYTISGYVRDSENQGISGVTLNFSNDGGSAITDSSGFYTRPVNSNWSGTVTPDKTCHTFAPSDTPYSNITSSQSDQNYTAATETYTISGYIRDSSANSGVSGVTLDFSNSGGSSSTDSSGFYSHSVDCGWNGTVTPSASAYTFSPSNLSYGSVTSDMSGQDYTAAQQAVPKISSDPESLTFFQSRFRKKRTDIFAKPEDSARQKTKPENLFSTFSRKNLRLSERQSDLLFNYEALDTTEDSGIVRVNADLLETADVLNLNLSEDAAYPVFRTRTDERYDGNFTWYGKTEDKAFGNAIFVVQNKEVTGTIRTGGELYALRPLGQGLHALIRQNPDSFPPEHPPEYAEGMIPASSTGSEKRHSVRSDDGSVITVLVAYTPAAAGSSGNINALIQLAVDESNQSYENSGISPRLELVHTYEVNYTESGDFGIDLNRFSGTGDGYMEDVHDLRDNYAADIAVLIINHTQYCGLAYLNLSLNPAHGFGVVYWNCATGYYSFAHEIGHIQNARHNPERDSSVYPYPYGHGYLNAPRDWRTIMAYNSSACPGGYCERIRYWSNPDVRYGGEVTGTASTHDNARVLDETAVAVSNFRVSESGTTLTIRNIGGATLTVSAVSDDRDWLSVSGYPDTPFTISPSGDQTVNAEVNWGSLGSSQQEGSITIDSDDPDTPSLVIPVTVIPVSGDEIAVLSVIPDYRNIEPSGGTGTFITDNIGTGSMSWTAESNVSWVTITEGSSGSNSGTVKFACQANSGSQARTGNITITTPSGENSPRSVEIIQSVIGDVDYNGTVELRDAVLALKVSAGKQVYILSASESGYAAMGVDVNGDEKIGQEEAIYVLQIIAE
ncbi:DUF1566 domain-containing protein [Desulfococcaceae bacterium HSG8]|nr:DUF1566 domain-containing protein [Desulfococcaceae bacterium HSG8]